MLDGWHTVIEVALDDVVGSNGVFVGKMPSDSIRRSVAEPVCV